MNNIATIQDFINIWYQRRNCCVHQGGCFKEDTTICNINNEKCITCKNNKHKINSVLEDIILSKAEKCVFEIINKHLSKMCNIKEIDSIELDNIMIIVDI